jgi:hypothetical protein
LNRPHDETDCVWRPRTPSVSSQYVPSTPEYIPSSSDTSPAKENPKGENKIDMDMIRRGMDVRSTVSYSADQTWR